MYQVIQRSDIILLQKITKLHIASHAEVPVILVFYSTHMGIITFVAQLPILVSATITPHPGGIDVTFFHIIQFIGCFRLVVEVISIRAALISYH